MIRKNLITMMLLLAASVSQGQEYDTKNEFGVTVGQSTVGLLLKQVLNDDGLKYSFKGYPVFTASFDRNVSTWLSTGIGFSVDSKDIEFKEYVDDEGMLQEGDFNASLSRFVVQIRAYAFYEKNEWRFRTGPRVGLSFWTADTDIADREFKFIDRLSNAVLPGVGYLLLGINYRPISEVSIGTEINLFAPYLVGGSVLIHI